MSLAVRIRIQRLHNVDETRVARYPRGDALELAPQCLVLDAVVISTARGLSTKHLRQIRDLMGRGKLVRVHVGPPMCFDFSFQEDITGKFGRQNRASRRPAAPVCRIIAWRPLIFVTTSIQVRTEPLRHSQDCGGPSFS
jgi:hypothetical protein